MNNNYMCVDESTWEQVSPEMDTITKIPQEYKDEGDELIGEDGVNLDTVNLSLDFDVWYAPGTDVSIATPELKSFIKENVESINENGMNNLFISNLMRKIEQKFAYVDHIRFRQINYYDSTYQAVKNYVTDLDDLTVEERRWYVPELLVCDLDDIDITEYIAT